MAAAGCDTEQMTDPLATVVVVTHSGADRITRCLDSISAQRVPHDVLVVDNASTDGTAQVLAERSGPETVLRLTDNAGFAGGVAAALPHINTEYLALLNDDAYAEPGWLDALLKDAAAQPATAAWTSVLVQADAPQTVQNAGVALLDDGYGADRSVGQPAEAMRTGSVFGFSGGAALLRTDAVRAVGGFPADFFLYYEDTDTSWRLRLAGWDIRLVADAIVRHEHAASSDRRSRAFHWFNERNRLSMLTREAPAPRVGAALGRFILTTGSLLVRQTRRRTTFESENLRVGLRIRVLLDWLRQLPALLRQRRIIGQAALTSRGAVWQRWAEPAVRQSLR